MGGSMAAGWFAILCISANQEAETEIWLGFWREGVKQQLHSSLSVSWLWMLCAQFFKLLPLWLLCHNGLWARRNPPSLASQQQGKTFRQQILMLYSSHSLRNHELFSIPVIYLISRFLKLLILDRCCHWFWLKSFIPESCLLGAESGKWKYLCWSHPEELSGACLFSREINTCSWRNVVYTTYNGSFGFFVCYKNMFFFF